MLRKHVGCSDQNMYSVQLFVWRTKCFVKIIMNTKSMNKLYCASLQMDIYTKQHNGDMRPA